MIFFATALTIFNNPASAKEMSMDVFHAKFQEATGKTWDEADFREKRDFVREYHKTFTETLKETKLKNPVTHEPAVEAGEESSNLKREATVQVRRDFLKENEKNWDDATAEEQETFLKSYKIKRQEEKQVEDQKIMTEQARQQEIEYQKQTEIWNDQQKKQNEEFKRLEDERLRQEKRAAEKQKLEEAFRRFEETRQKMREKRMQQQR